MKNFFNKQLLVCIVTMLLITTACRKEGTGGKSMVSGYVKHHTALIPNATVYIKYGASEFPGTNTAIYDASVTTGSDAHYEFKNLRKGDYYLYGVGYDTQGSHTVMGGIGIKLKYNTTTITDVPVTE